MATEKQNRDSIFTWTYKWSDGSHPFVCFMNPRLSTNLIYPIEDVERILARGNVSGHYLAVPLRVMQEAYDSLKSEQESA